MSNQKISTRTGAIILVIIAITVGVFVWVYEKNQPNDISYAQIPSETRNKVTQPSTNHPEQPAIASEEFPTIQIQPGVSLEDTIEQALYKKYPNWKSKNFNVAVTVETNQGHHAIGRVAFDDGRYNVGESIWFAAESDNSWTLTNVSGVGYWGSCQSFQKYRFPKDMTPDCWDTEKNILIDTSNPQRFYPDGFTKKDKKELVQAYIEYANKNAPEGLGHWQPDEGLYVKINKSVGNYLNGIFFIGSSKNISAPGFYATKQSGEWIVVDTGQDTRCDVLSQYGFPEEIKGSCEPIEKN